MIPAILAAPLVEGVVGSVAGGVMGGVSNLFSPPSSASSAAPSSFTTSLANAASANAAARASISAGPSGTMRSDDWNQMGHVDLQTWAQGLAGKHVDATDATGRSITGTVTGVQQLGNTLALNIGGHLVSLSQLKQVSWSPSVA